MLTKSEAVEFIKLFQGLPHLSVADRRRYKDLFQRSLQGVYIRSRILSVERLINDNGTAANELTLSCGHVLYHHASRGIPKSGLVRCHDCTNSVVAKSAHSLQ